MKNVERGDTTESIVRSLAALGEPAVTRLEKAATDCADTENGLASGCRVSHDRVKAECAELEAAREAIAAPIRQAVELVKARAAASPFIRVSFNPPSPLRQALDLIGPAMNEDHFHVRLCIAALILRRILDTYQNQAIQVDPVTKLADVCRLETEMTEALAGTEFTAKVLQPDGAHRLVVDLNPKVWRSPLEAWMAESVR